MANHWTPAEIGRILDTYFQMLDLEVRGIKFSKTDFRKKLLPLLNRRSEGSIEYKLQNISAVLRKYGMPFILGYKPAVNYQQLLEELVIDYLTVHRETETVFKNFTQHVPQSTLPEYNFPKLLSSAPSPLKVEESQANYSTKIIKKDYLEIEQKNQKLGQLGEELVFRYEKWDLERKGFQNLAKQVRWISHDEGDGAGFDILSKDYRGKDKFVEVKTTKLSEHSPFFFSRNELTVSQQKDSDYFLYRVYRFGEKTGMYVKQGRLDSWCQMEPINFMGRLG